MSDEKDRRDQRLEDMRLERDRLKAENARLAAALGQFRPQTLTMDEAERLARRCKYGIDAVEDGDSNLVDWGDAAGFFLEGWLHARRGIRSINPNTSLRDLLRPVVELLERHISCFHKEPQWNCAGCAEDAAYRVQATRLRAVMGEKV